MPIDFQSYYEKFYPKSRENSAEPIRKTDAKTYKNFNLDDRHDSKKKKKSIELTHKDSINLAKMHHQISSKKPENIKNPSINLHVGSGQISATTEYGHKIYTPTQKTQSKPVQKNQMNALRENFWRSRPENRLSKSILNQQPRSRSAAAGNLNYSDNGLYRNSNQRINLNLSNKKNLNDVFYINSIFPATLSLLSTKLNYRFIHISTDCVFNGKKGNYTERDLTDGNDYYARSKILGEHITSNSTVKKVENDLLK